MHMRRLPMLALPLAVPARALCGTPLTLSPLPLPSLPPWRPLQPYVKGQSTSAVLNYNTKKYTELLKATGGIHGTRNAFCGGMTSSADQHIFIFGGHSGDVQWFRRYNHNDRSMEKPKQMSSPRWYLGAATMPDAKVVVIGGVKKSGAAGYGATDRTQDNPTYEMYNPVTG